MVRVVGNIGTAVNGTLHIKPSNPFVGVDAGYKAYPVIEGLVDIDIAPTPRGVSYLVDFQPEGSFGNPSPQERWSIPPQAEVSLDLLRFPRQRRSPTNAPTVNAFDGLEANLLRQEQGQLHGEIEQLRLATIKAKEEKAIAERMIESLRAEVAELQTKLYLAAVPRETVVEKIVEKVVVEKIGEATLMRENRTLHFLVDDLRVENQRLLDILEASITAHVIVPDEDVAIVEVPRLSPNASPAEQLDYLLRSQEGY